jgi:hypothetical protein
VGSRLRTFLISSNLYSYLFSASAKFVTSVTDWVSTGAIHLAARREPSPLFARANKLSNVVFG